MRFLINPDLFTFIEHWSFADRKKAAAVLHKETSKYLKNHKISFDDLMQDALTAIVDKYQKKKELYDATHVKFTVRSELSRKYGSDRRKKTLHYDENMVLFSVFEKEKINIEDLKSTQNSYILDDIIRFLTRSLSSTELRFFMLHFIEEYSVSETSKLLNIDRINLQRTKKKILEKIEKQYFNL